MTYYNISLNNFKGLRPALGNLQAGDIGVLRGRNFRFSLRGPYSGWGNRIISKAIPDSDFPYFATFRAGDRVVACTVEGIFEQRQDLNWYKVISNTPLDWGDQYNDYPWTTAQVSENYYFSHPMFGIAKYDAYNCCWSKLDLCCEVDLNSEAKFLQMENACGSLIAGPILGITQSFNRLVVLAKDTVSWSVADDGDNLSCGIDCGGGFQSLSHVGYGQPLGVKPLPDDGFMVYTTNGMFRMDPINSRAVFRASKVLTRHNLPINPWAITTNAEDVNYFVSRAGLFRTDGKSPDIAAPEIGEYLVQDEIPNFNYLRNQHAVALFFLRDTQELFVSLIAHSTEQSAVHLYTRSLVYSEKYERASSFDQPHYFVGEVNTYEHRLTADRQGFIPYDRQIRLFDGSRFNAKRDPDNSLAVIPAPLDSFIELGPIGTPDQEYANRESELMLLKIHTGPAVGAMGDRLEAVYSGIDNWQDFSRQWSNYDLGIKVTTDGYTVDEYSFSMMKPSTAHYYMQSYSCKQNGEYHTIKLSAEQLGQYYELNRVDAELQTTTIAGH